jgi:hypothetical protein
MPLDTELDRGTIAANLTRFSARWAENVAGWSAAERSRSESSSAQTFWADLLRQFGIIPERINLFEREAQRASTGGRGSIDVFYPAVFLGEAKSAGRDLGPALLQAQDYLLGGSISQREWPAHIIVTNFEQFRVVKSRTTGLSEPDDSFDITFPLVDLSLHVDQLLFLVGRETVSQRQEAEASVHAAKVMAALYTSLVGDETDIPVGDEAPHNPDEEDPSVQAASMLLTRLLFLLYGDDAGLWEADLFYRFVLYDTTDTNLGGQLAQLFTVLNTPVGHRRHVPDTMDRFPYVNGALYQPHPDEPSLAFLPSEFRDALLAACRFRWTRISPAVFGSMFQMVKSRQARHSGGEHYTTETNIRKTIGPLFLDELDKEADRLCGNRSTTLTQLREFQDQLATIVCVDPAAGAGNFLNVAYRWLRDIETRIIVELYRRQRQQTLSMDVSLDTKVTIGQFNGIEISWWPCRIAQTAMFLVDHQANRALAQAIGTAPDRLPITITAHIHHANALTTDWRELLPETTGPTYAFGNPPFLGKSQRSAQQTREMREAWGRDYSGEMDFVTTWFRKAADLLAERAGAFAFVATSSAFQGISTKALVGPLRHDEWQTKFAHQPFDWSSEVPNRAAVHCAIAGFTKEAGMRHLYTYDDRGDLLADETVPNINPYLIAGPDVFVQDSRQALNSQVARRMSFGAMAADGGSNTSLGGRQSAPKGLLIAPEQVDDFLNDPAAAPFIRPFVGSRELIRGDQRWCIWMPEPNHAAIAESPLLRERFEYVKTFRSQYAADAEVQRAAATPYAFMRPNKLEEAYLCIPRHFSYQRSYITAAVLPPEVVAGDATVITIDPEGLMFALVSSSMFMTWQRAVGGRLRNDLRFAAEVTWNTFPMPLMTEQQRTAISRAGQRVADVRAQHNATLSQLYSPLGMPRDLVDAHRALDTSVNSVFPRGAALRRLQHDSGRLDALFESYGRLRGML